jgi:hypothetical protein
MKLRKYELFCWETLYCFGVAIITIAVLLLFGCETQRNNKDNLKNQLVVPNGWEQSDWVTKYGDGLESLQTANIVMAIQAINNQAIELTKESSMTDPNIHWASVYYWYDKNIEGPQLGLCSDGTVVWRMNDNR